ncbi:ent-kaurenoic acid oxidase 1 isoform X1 [Coffea arabica]|uniref:Ent-kaurenoic acid oxidase 1 isoform X1 n=1 Tax=Coffea arabica TaxID=13443 RepID=A0A6P6XC97_COFAR|nr:ent-kaurenoic acid oxidase 1-like [Coffea arabica]
MEIALGMWIANVVGIITLLGWGLWWWNYFRFALPVTFQRLRGRTTMKLPPGHMGIPFFGEMLHFLWYFKVIRRPDDFINNKRDKYGDGEGLYKSHLFGSPSIIASSPSANKFILQSDANFGMGWPATQIIGNNSLLFLQGSSHARIRGLVVKIINQPDALRKIAIMVQPRIVAALRLWSEKGRIVALQEAKKVTFENIGKYFCGFEPGRHLDTLDQLFAGMIKGVRSQPIKIPGTAYHHALQCRKKVMTILTKEINKRKFEGNAARAEFDLLDQLLNLKDDDGHQLQDEEVLDNIVGLIIAGYESTSLSIMWILYYLAKYPNVLKKLREEHINVGTNGDFITRDGILKLQYTNKVVEETIRLANVSAFVFRTAKRDVEYRGYKIPKGWKVICWLRYIHTDPKNFEDPLCFNPDRWNEQPKPGTFLVFGGGSKICPGNMLARMQVAIFIHHLVVGYRWELVNEDAEMSYLPHPRPIDGVEINISRT